MNDLFNSDLEIACNERFEERAGIVEYCGLLTREEAEKQGKLESEDYRRSCELRTIHNMDVPQRRDYFSKVQKARGKESAECLREAFRAYWISQKVAA